MNTLYFGDNLEILRDKIESDTIDLIYLDPPFQSGKNYNIIFQPELGKVKGANAQIKTFEDTWHWGEEAEREYRGLIEGTLTKERLNQKTIDMMKAMRDYLGESSLMAYLSMMASRLLEMRRVLKDTGSIYLHCDPTASHYLKILMDAIFGVENFRNEIVWCYTGREHPGIKIFPKRHQIIFFYTKHINGTFTFNRLFREYDKGYTELYFDRKDDNGRIFRWQPDGRGGRYKQYLDESPGIRIPDWWEIKPLHGKDYYTMHKESEYLGYPTQKPEKLLERIIKASSNEGDLVLDPFCGCGTTIAVAEKLGRNWIGIDITYIAIDVIKKRLEKSGIKEGINFTIDGEPKDLYAAGKLAEKDPFQFQIWCITKLKATPSQVKTGDQGVDGIINFIDPSKSNKVGKGIIQVKGTKSVNPSMVRDLKGTMKSQNADFAILITLKEPTTGMKNEALKEGYYKLVKKDIPKIQLLTVEDLFKNPITVILPQSILPSYDGTKIEKEKINNLFEIE